MKSTTLLEIQGHRGQWFLMARRASRFDARCTVSSTNHRSGEIGEGQLRYRCYNMEPVRQIGNLSCNIHMNDPSGEVSFV